MFELNRNFRNEGLSRRHNPEFTMLEAYWAYADFEQMAELMEELICQLAGNATQIEHRDAEGNVTRTINLARPWRRARYRDLIGRSTPDGSITRPPKRLSSARQRWAWRSTPGMADFEVTQQMFEKLIEEKTFDPLFVTHLPKELVPLAKQNAEDPSLVDVFELVINGMEFAPGYTELNDPDVQRARLLEQAGGETQSIDEDFLLALEHGMPPGGRHRAGDRPADDAAHRLGQHPRRDPVPAPAAEGVKFCADTQSPRMLMNFRTAEIAEAREGSRRQMKASHPEDGSMRHPGRRTRLPFFTTLRMPFVLSFFRGWQPRLRLFCALRVKIPAADGW